MRLHLNFIRKNHRTSVLDVRKFQGLKLVLASVARADFLRSMVLDRGLSEIFLSVVTATNLKNETQFSRNMFNGPLLTLDPETAPFSLFRVVVHKCQ